jgi:hypothetical protein
MTMRLCIEDMITYGYLHLSYRSGEYEHSKQTYALGGYVIHME